MYYTVIITSWMGSRDGKVSNFDMMPATVVESAKSDILEFLQTSNFSSHN